MVAERPLARHSELLVTRPPEADEVAQALADRIARLEDALADELADLLGGVRPVVTCGKTEQANSGKLHKIIEPVANNFRFADVGGREVLASLSHGSALALTDQVFGGSGEWAGSLPESMPASASLTLRRAAEALGSALGAMFDHSEAIPLVARGEIIGKFVSTNDAGSFITCRAEVAVGESKPWNVLLMWREAHASSLLDQQPVHASPTADLNIAQRLSAQPFAQIPLPLRAVLARIDVPVSRISDLAPGDTLPLTLGSTIALRMADREIARGEVGASDGVLALRLSSIAWNSLLKGQEQ